MTAISRKSAWLLCTINFHNQAPQADHASRQDTRTPAHPFDNIVKHHESGQALAERDGWIYRLDLRTGAWLKLFPGSCPAWHPSGEHFYYFRDEGTGEKHLWRADPTGDNHRRLSKHTFPIKESPAISYNGAMLAWHLDACSTPYNRHEIVTLRISDTGVFWSAYTVARYSADVCIGPVEWSPMGTLLVDVDGKLEEIDVDPCESGYLG